MMKDKSSSPAHAALLKIADALDVSVENLLAIPPSTGPIVSSDECLRLWSKLRTEEGQRQALAVLRMIAALEQK